VEDEDAMAARGGGAVERGGPVGGNLLLFFLFHNKISKFLLKYVEVNIV